MKKFGFLVSCLLLTGAFASHGQATAYPMKLSAQVLLDETNLPAVVSIRQNNLVGPNRLILVVDRDLNEISLVSADNTSVVATLAESTHVAILGNGLFSANLTFTDLLISNNAFTKLGTGDMQIRGKLVDDSSTGDPRSASGRIYGLFNDAVNGNTDEPNMLIKGTFGSAGAPFDPSDIGL